MSDISSLYSGFSDYYSLQRDVKDSSERAGKVTGAMGGLSSASSREDVEDAVKSFESYFLEQVLKKEKEINDAWNDDEEKDAYAQQIEDLYMDDAIKKVSEDMVSQNFGRLTDTFTEQIMRNYHIEDSAKAKSDGSEDREDPANNLK